MSAIRGKDSTPEMVVRGAMHRLGFRFRLHSRALPGRPDIVMRKRHIVIFVHGCFWHRHEGCRYATTPSTRKKFWVGKFAQNVLRDWRSIDELRQMGWRILVVWDCALRKRGPDDPVIQKLLSDWISSSQKQSQITTL